MPLTNAQRFNPVSRAFHWLTVILVLAAFILSEGGPESRIFADANRDALTRHEFLGFAVFVVTILRIVWTLFNKRPEPVPMPGWMHSASRIAEFALVALLVMVPLTAILGSWFEAHPLYLYFGTYASPFAAAAGTQSAWLSIHPLLGDAIMWIAGLHAAAALYHHFVLKDDVLRTMLPGGQG